MDAFLQHRLRVARQGQRTNLIAAGLGADLVSCRHQEVSYAKTVCDGVRKQGGANATAADRQISAQVQTSIRDFIYLTRLLDLTQRDIASTFGAIPVMNAAGVLDAAADATARDQCMLMLESTSLWLRGLKDQEPTAAKYTATCNTKKWLEEMEYDLENMLGTNSGVPLDYIIRDPGDVPPPDLGFGMVMNPLGLPAFSMDQFNLHEDIRLRARHDGYFYVQDNTSVYNYLHSKCHGTDAYASIKGFARTKNGRTAWINLKTSFLGIDAKDNLHRIAENKLRTISFNGKNRNFPWLTFISKLETNFSDIRIQDTYSEMKKVDVLLHALQITNMDWAKGQVMSNAALRNDFRAAAQFIHTCMLQTKNQAVQPAPNPRSISQVDTKPNPKPKPKGKHTSPKVKANKFDPRKPWQSVTLQAYRQMTDDQKKAMKDARSKHKDKGSTRNTSSVETGVVAMEVEAPPAQQDSTVPIGRDGNLRLNVVATSTQTSIAEQFIHDCNAQAQAEARSQASRRQA